MLVRLRSSRMAMALAVVATTALATGSLPLRGDAAGGGPAPLAWYPLNQRDLGFGTERDASGHGYHAIMGLKVHWDDFDPAFASAGRHGGALQFSPDEEGPDFLLIEPHPALKPARFTFMAWVNATDIGDPEAEDHSRVVSADVEFTNSRSTSLSLQREADCDAGPCAEVHFGFTNAACGEGALWNRYAITGAIVETGRWTHVAGTFNGSALKVYVDGDLEANTTTPDCFEWSNEPICIGARCSVLDSWFDGRIDEVKIFDRALTRDEVVAAMG